MKRVKGFDDATGFRVYALSDWICKDDVERLRRAFNKAISETGLPIMAADYMDIPNGREATFEDWIKMHNEPGMYRVNKLRVACYAGSDCPGIMIVDDDTCGFFDDAIYETPEELEEQWNNEYYDYEA